MKTMLSSESQSSKNISWFSTMGGIELELVHPELQSMLNTLTL